LSAFDDWQTKQRAESGINMLQKRRPRITVAELEWETCTRQIMEAAAWHDAVHADPEQVSCCVRHEEEPDMNFLAHIDSDDDAPQLPLVRDECSMVWLPDERGTGHGNDGAVQLVAPRNLDILCVMKEGPATPPLQTRHRSPSFQAQTQTRDCGRSSAGCDGARDEHAWSSLSAAGRDLCDVLDFTNGMLPAVVSQVQELEAKQRRFCAFIRKQRTLLRVVSPIHDTSVLDTTDRAWHTAGDCVAVDLKRPHQSCSCSTEEGSDTHFRPCCKRCTSGHLHLPSLRGMMLRLLSSYFVLQDKELQGVEGEVMRLLSSLKRWARFPDVTLEFIPQCDGSVFLVGHDMMCGERIELEGAVVLAMWITLCMCLEPRFAFGPRSASIMENLRAVFRISTMAACRRPSAQDPGTDVCPAVTILCHAPFDM
jgi:hypothetical protein